MSHRHAFFQDSMPYEGMCSLSLNVQLDHLNASEMVVLFLRLSSMMFFFIVVFEQRDALLILLSVIIE